MKIQGEIFTGLGEGAEYVGMKPYQKKIKNTTGFYPFPGTLNVKVDSEKLENLKELVERQVIESFAWQGDTYSRVEVYPVKIEGVKAAYLNIDITDHGADVMEIVAEDNLREKLGLDDEDNVEITSR